MNHLDKGPLPPGMSEPWLSSVELELLDELGNEGVQIAGMTLGRDAQGRIFVDRFEPMERAACPEPEAPSEALQSKGISLDELGRQGLQMYELGLYRQASARFRLEVRMRLYALGSDHPDALTAASNLAMSLLAQGDLAAARAIHEWEYAICTDVLGPEHPDTLTSANNLGETMRAQGDAAGARKIHESALETCQRVLGPDHAETLTVACNLAETLRDQGHLVAARRMHEEVYETRQRVLGPEHADTLNSGNNLASALHAQGDLPGARRLHQEVYEWRQRVLGPEHPETLTSANNLALTLSAQGDFAGARALYELDHKACKDALGPEHPDTLIAASNLAEALSDEGDLAGARAIEESIYPVFQSVLGAEHPDTLTCGDNLASKMRAQGALTDACRLHERVYDARQRVLGPEHPDTLTSAHNLAITYYELDELAACGTVFRTLLRSLCEAGVATDVAFHVAGNVPMLEHPTLPWSDAVVESLRALLPSFSRLLSERLEILPQESWDLPHSRFQWLHHKWLAFASHHAPEHVLSALGGLHGILSFSQVRAEMEEVQAVSRQVPVNAATLRLSICWRATP